MKKVFTTGQVAKICKVAPRTVSKWFDSGRLRGYRIPGSQDRRIPREQLIRFLNEHGMPLAELEDETTSKVLLVGLDLTVVTGLRDRLPESDGFQIEVAASEFEAGMQAVVFNPDCVVIDAKVGLEQGVIIANNMRRKPEHQHPVTIALVCPEPTSIDLEMAMRRAFNEIFHKPLDIALLAERIRRMIAEHKTAAA